MKQPIDKGGTCKVLVTFVLLLAAASVPVFSTVLPPLVDYPNHLARLHLIAEGGNVFYAVRWAPLPDLAADIVVPVLAWAMPLDLVGKLFLTMSFALIAGGTLWLNRVATARWRVWPLLACLLLYNRSLLWGFVNYLFGLGLAMCGVALWLALEDRPWLRLLFSVPIALACFFSHIAAFGVYALAIGGVELLPVIGLLRDRQHRTAGRRVAAAAMQFVLPAIILIGFEPVSSGRPISYAFWRKADLLFSVFDNYSRAFDIVCFAMFALLLGGLAWQGRLAMAPRLGIAVAVVSAAYLALPAQILSGSGADHRLPLALFLLLIAATAPSLPGRSALFIGGAAAAIFAARMAVVEAVWLKSDRLYAADIAAIDSLPEDAKLAVAFPAHEINAGGIPQLHVATLAAARREAFVPTLFAYATQQPLVLRPPYDTLADATSPAALWAAFVGADMAERLQITSVLAAYDFVVFANREAFIVPPRPCLRPMTSPPNFQLFAVNHAQPCF